MISIDIEKKGQSFEFIFKCDFGDNAYVTPMPDRRFRKGSRTWAAPALRRNLEYMRSNFNNKSMYSEEAWKFLKEKLKEIDAKTGKVPDGVRLFPSWYRFKTDPMPWQARTFNLAWSMDEYAILYDQGMGKTYTAINLATAWRMDNNIDAAVVVCPASIKLVWNEELAKHCPVPYQFHALSEGKYGKADAFIYNKTDFQWFVVGIEALSQGHAVDYLNKFLTTRRCVFIVDESSDIANFDTIRTDRVIKNGKEAEKRLILSGTPLLSGLEHFYSQYKFLNENILGFDSYYPYRAHFCKLMYIEVPDVKRGGVREIPKIVGYKNEDEFVKLTAPYTSRVEKTDEYKMPEKVVQVRRVKMTPAQKKMYVDMNKEMYIDIGALSGIEGDEYAVTSTLEKSLRLAQITGGFYPSVENNKVVPTPIPGVNPKLKELLHILNDTNGKVVIWCLYRSEIAMIADALRKEEIPFVEFHGGKDDLEKEYAVREFRKGSARVFLATRAAAKGLTLIESFFAIYYSFGYSLIDYLQSQDRIHRLGQDNTCTYMHLVCEGTVDEAILSVLEGKKSLTQMVYDIMKTAIKDYMKTEFEGVLMDTIGKPLVALDSE